MSRHQPNEIWHPGIIKSFDKNTGYGFVILDDLEKAVPFRKPDTPPEIFIHRIGWQTEGFRPSEGLPVEVRDVRDTRKGLKAQHSRLKESHRTFSVGTIVEMGPWQYFTVTSFGNPLAEEDLTELSQDGKWRVAVRRTIPMSPIQIHVYVFVLFQRKKKPE